MKPQFAVYKKLRRNASFLVRETPHLIRTSGVVDGAVFATLHILGVRRIRRIRIGGEPLCLRTSTPDVSVALSCLVHGEFAAIGEIRSSADVRFVVDAGGHVGAAAIALARQFPSAKVVTIEPHYENFRILKHNVHYFTNIVPINAALATSNGMVPLRDRHCGNWGFTTVPMPADVEDAPDIGQVPSISIESLLERFEQKEIDVLKLDIEGAEREVLQASREWMARVGLVVAELHDHIAPGSSKAFKCATKGMRRQKSYGEKAVAYRDR